MLRHRQNGRSSGDYSALDNFYGSQRSCDNKQLLSIGVCDREHRVSGGRESAVGVSLMVGLGLRKN